MTQQQQWQSQLAVLCLVIIAVVKVAGLAQQSELARCKATTEAGKEGAASCLLKRARSEEAVCEEAGAFPPVVVGCAAAHSLSRRRLFRDHPRTVGCLLSKQDAVLPTRQSDTAAGVEQTYWTATLLFGAGWPTQCAVTALVIIAVAADGFAAVPIVVVVPAAAVCCFQIVWDLCVFELGF